MTGQSLLDLMELLNQELQLQTSEADVVRGLLALNAAQDLYETVAASQGHMSSDNTTTASTVADTETTTFPTGLIRLDKIQMLDSNSVPIYDLDPIDEVGGHITASDWPFTIASTTVPGRPTKYWTNGRNIYWNPTPDDAYTVRFYGFIRAADITADGTFLYDDGVALPLAAFAVRLMKTGVGDNINDAAVAAQEAFKAAIEMQFGLQRQSASAFQYRYSHDA